MSCDKLMSWVGSKSMHYRELWQLNCSLCVQMSIDHSHLLYNRLYCRLYCRPVCIYVGYWTCSNCCYSPQSYLWISRGYLRPSSTRLQYPICETYLTRVSITSARTHLIMPWIDFRYLRDTRWLVWSTSASDEPQGWVVMGGDELHEWVVINCKGEWWLATRVGGDRWWWTTGAVAGMLWQDLYFSII